MSPPPAFKLTFCYPPIIAIPLKVSFRPQPELTPRCLFEGGRRSRPPLPRNGIRRGRASLRCVRSTPVESRRPTLSPPFLAVRVPDDGLVILGTATSRE